MRHLILSDLHANWQALEAVLADSGQAYDDIWCLGDLVGYGADPDRVVRWVRSHVALVIRGNHDRAAGDSGADEYSHQEAVQWIRQAIGEENQAYLRALPAGPLDADGCRLVHGAPHDEDAYLETALDVEPQLAARSAGIIFFGHTHKQGGFVCGVQGIEGIPAPGATVSHATLRLRPEVGHLINPGSVGQPRDRDPRAAYLLYDSAARTVEFRRTCYDIAAAQRSIRSAGLPEKMARRLDLGL